MTATELEIIPPERSDPGAYSSHRDRSNGVLGIRARSSALHHWSNPNATSISSCFKEPNVLQMTTLSCAELK